MKKSKQRNFGKIPVRFNYRFNGKVQKLALLPGGSASFHHYAPTEEGWQSEDETIRLIGRTLYLKWVRDGRDCDGRLTQYGTSICSVLNRASVRHRSHGSKKRPRDRFPSWEMHESRQRDESAERMGY